MSEFLLERQLSGHTVNASMVEQNLSEEMDVDVEVANEEEVESDDEEEAEGQNDVDNEMYYELRSGKRRRIDIEETNIDQKFDEIPLRAGHKVFSKECIEAIVKTNVACHTSINQARKRNENIFNGQNYRLEPENKPTEMPRTKSDFQQYKNVVPSEKTIWYHHRHHYALSK